MSYQQIYAWVRKYEEGGIDKLKDNQGRTKPAEEMTEVEKLKVEMKILEEKNRQLEIENAFIKNAGAERGWSLTGVRQEHIYMAIEFLNVHNGYSISGICDALKLNRSSYYKWKNRKQSKSELLNIQITEYIKDYYEESNGVLGYRQMCIKVNREKIDELSHKVNVTRRVR